MFCNQCGHRNPPGSNFCSSCGASLNLTEVEDTTMTHVVTPAEEREADEDLKVSPDELAGSAALLVVRKGPNEGSKYMLDAEVTRAGRHPDSDIFLDDITVSRRHAEIIRRADGFHVVDVGSLNGTYVNRDRVEDTKLTNGDELQIGKFKLVFFTGAGELSENNARSIGEILDDLRGDFPDISVSKIRFLESQGLINPERSPSGYRQFTDADLELLRWILRQQRDHYLPLKVIRRRLKEGDGPHREVDVSAPESAVAAAPAATASAPASAPVPAPARVAAASVVVDEARLKLPDPPKPAEDDVWLVSDGPDPATAAPAPAPAADELWPADGHATYSAQDIRRQTGLDEKAMSELESFGLLPPAGPEGYGPEALRVARIAAAFFAYGVEARHLRMYKRAAEQEATFFSQVAMPMMNAKDSGAAARASEALTELARLGAGLRLSMLRIGIGPPPRGTGGVPPTEAAGAAQDRA